ncbi:response regulator [Oscillatoria sp. CS-180]|uniref:response regulator n=1 Tax=Oscillatoria sp. CS-180 TaxID=3021720 RepID=UPI00232A8B2B|nr:response regulator [Oscillatoria sp. CS-180]MDB9529113.1 response regulator [Oscillatoria sp. CS-180]
MMNTNTYNILLVEDDPNDILFIQRAFRQTNAIITLYSVKDGDAAVDYLTGVGEYSDRDRYPIPALVLLDLKLPRRSGTEVLEWIRKKSDMKRMPVVILTSSSERPDVDLSYDLGVNSYLVKPVSFDALSRMVGILDAYWIRLNQYPSVVLAT